IVQKSRFGSGWEGAAWNHCSSVWQDEATKKKCGLCKSNTGLEGRSKGPYLKTRTPGKVNCPGVPDSSERHSVDVVQLAALTTRNLQKNQIKKPTKPTEWTIRRPFVGQISESFSRLAPWHRALFAVYWSEFLAYR